MRGQAHTLEGFAAGLLVLGAVAFALQATAVTPLSASTSNQHIENQQTSAGEDLLSAAQTKGELRPTLLYWNTSENEFRDSGPRGVYANGGPPTPFGTALNETFGQGRIGYNVDVYHRTPDGGRDRIRMVDMGTPSDNAAASSRTVVLFDDDEITESDGDGTTGTTRTVANASAEGEFYASDVEPDGPLFNVLEVRVIVWRV